MLKLKLYTMKKNLLFYEKGISLFLLSLFVMMITATGVSAQNRQVTGKVVANENDSSLRGVTIKVKGSAVSTSTNADGTFSISAPANATLLVTNIGYAAQEIALNNRTNIS